MCLPLPGAYRSLLRPSSPDGAKAFTVCPLYLDQKNWSEFGACPIPNERNGQVSCSALLYAIVKERSRSRNARSGKSSSRCLTPPWLSESENLTNHHVTFTSLTESFIPTPPSLSTPASSTFRWWACLESNRGPRPYQGRALTN